MKITTSIQATKQVISRKYYPCYHGQYNTTYSYRGFFIGQRRNNTRDYQIGICDASVPDGWVRGVRGAEAARTYEAVQRLAGWRPL